MRKTIDPARRRHQDYLRIKALRAARVYETRLKTLRRKEVKRVLNLCNDHALDEWAGIIENQLSEPYIRDIESGLFLSVGIPQAKSTVRDMNRAKANESDILESLWMTAIENYANERAGELIVTVSGSLKSQLINILQEQMAGGVTGIEKVTLAVFDKYKELELWQIRRIIQTEAMIGLGKAGDVAARTLGIKFTKQWAVSGLGNSRDTHIEVDGKIVGQEEPFHVGNSYLMYPHDTSLNAEAKEIINCACTAIRMPV